MSDETYYTVLNVKETASSAEIKTAYRALIKQVHPDTKANLAPYLRKIAEDKTKELIEAYTVLSNFSKRRDYDRQLAEYRRQTMPQARPAPQPTRRPTTPTASFGYCNRCRTALYASGYCWKCGKVATPAAARAASPPRPWLVVFAVFCSVLYSVAFIRSHFEDANTSQSPTNTSQLPTPPPEFTVDENPTGTQSSTPPVSVSGTYVGTIHNPTANLAFTVVIHQTASGLLKGCALALHVSGELKGSVRGSKVNFVVHPLTNRGADTIFWGDTLKNTIAGSSVSHDGQQLGDFRLTKQIRSNVSYVCTNGAVTEDWRQRQVGR
jgi:hypothetical protein